MNTNHPTRRRTAASLAAGLLSAGLLFSLSSAVFAAPGAADAALQSPEARFRADRAACIEGRTGQVRAACLKEAGAALATARATARQTRQGPAAPDYTANALSRCERLPDADRADCRLRMQGHGSHEGSVAGGGILYELVTKSVGAPVPTASPR